MHTAYLFTKYLHAGLGVAALLSFWIAALAKKGSRPHKLAGKVYVGVMIGLLLPAIPLSWRTLQHFRRDYGEEGDLVYLVTDFIDGPSLRAVLDAEGAMPWPKLEPLLTQLVEAARVLHRKNGLLCGLSPEIIRVAADEDGPRLMISTAGIWQAQDLLATMGDATLRGSGMVDIEVHYVAPELLTGQSADVRSDVFTMGVLAYEMATATLPFTGATMPALLGAMLRGRVADPRERQPTLPEPVARAIVSALSAAPEDRPQTARELGAAIAAR